VIDRSHNSHDGTQCRALRPAIVLAALLLVVTVSPGQAGYSGGTGMPDDPYLISTPADLLALAADPNDWAYHFRMTADIDMAAVPTETTCIIGDRTFPFKGTFDGAGKRILHFTCICTDGERMGLFGHIRGMYAEVRDLCLIDPNVDGGVGTSTGALVGHLGTGTVTRCHVEGAQVSGYIAVGGLVGWNYGTIIECTAQGEVVGDYSVGGLTGICAWDAQVRDCRADVHVTGSSRVGGLAGGGTLATIQWSSAGGSASGWSDVGGLVGCSEGATISNCYSTTSVMGNSLIGGLIGYCDMSCKCSAGSLPSVIRNSYSVGPVIGVADTGGLIGMNEPNCVVQNCFWDTQTSGMTASAEGTGLPTVQLQVRRTFTNAWWSFTAQPAGGEYWTIRREPQYPIPAWQIIDGDFDGDGDVDLQDFSEFARAWSQPGASFRTGGADTTGDDFVDTLDLQALCERWLVGAKHDR
jgi:hypothetical protein